MLIYHEIIFNQQKWTKEFLKDLLSWCAG